MTTHVLVDVDTQHDFVHPDGALHVPARAGVIEAIAAELAAAEASGRPIVGSVDSHAYDAWEFADNGGPFPPHCVKGTAGWLRVTERTPARTRFVPMQHVDGDVRNVVGERRAGEGNRIQGAAALAREARDGVGLYFEKEVYSLFMNPAAAPVLVALVALLGGREAVVFDVLGYCTGGYCVDAAALGLAERGYRVRVLGYATTAIGGDEGEQHSRRVLGERGIPWIERQPGTS